MPKAAGLTTKLLVLWQWTSPYFEHCDLIIFLVSLIVAEMWHQLPVPRTSRHKKLPVLWQWTSPYFEHCFYEKKKNAKIAVLDCNYGGFHCERTNNTYKN